MPYSVGCWQGDIPDPPTPCHSLRDIRTLTRCVTEPQLSPQLPSSAGWTFLLLEGHYSPSPKEFNSVFPSWAPHESLQVLTTAFSWQHGANNLALWCQRKIFSQTADGKTSTVMQCHSPTWTADCPPPLAPAGCITKFKPRPQFLRKGPPLPIYWEQQEFLGIDKGITLKQILKETG